MTQSRSPLASADDMELTEQEMVRRKQFLEFQDDDVQRLGAIGDLALQYADAVIDDFYTHLMAFDETKSFFKDPAHEHIGLPVKSYLGMYNFYLRAVAGRLTSAFKGDPDKAFQTFLSLMKLTFLDIGLAIDTYIFSRERPIREQQEAIQELPTPVLPFRENMLIVPVIGLLDSQRARQLTEQLLHSIRANRAKVVVIDITGVQAVDSKVANHIVQTVEAARLMGATVIVAGLSPDVAQTMVTLGVDLARIETVGDLQSGIERAEELLGYQMVRKRAPAAGMS